MNRTEYLILKIVKEIEIPLTANEIEILIRGRHPYVVDMESGQEFESKVKTLEAKFKLKYSFKTKGIETYEIANADNQTDTPKEKKLKNLFDDLGQF